jgi:hypothetical protein
MRRTQRVGWAKALFAPCPRCGSDPRGHAEFIGWPVGLPLRRPLSGGLWEVRSSLPSKREGRVLFGFYDGLLIALHAFVKKRQKTSSEDIALARQRLKEVSP